MTQVRRNENDSQLDVCYTGSSTAFRHPDPPCSTYHPHSTEELNLNKTKRLLTIPHTNQIEIKKSNFVPTVSLFPRVRSKRSREICLIDFLNDIKTGTGTSNKSQIIYIRREKDEAKAKEEKEKLPAITPSGLFNGRRIIENLIQHTSIFNVDIDVVDNPEFFANERKVQQLLREIKKLPYWLASWRTISYGISFLFKINPKEHAAAYYSFEHDFQQLGVIIDDNCKDISRLRITSYDEDLEYNSLLEESFNSIPCYTLKQLTEAVKVKATEEKRAGTLCNNTEITPEAGEDAVSFAVRSATNRGHSFIAGRRHKFILYVSGLLNRLGLPLEIALAQIERHISLSKHEDHTATFIDIYSRYRNEHGASPFRNRQKLSDFLSPVLTACFRSCEYTEGQIEIKRYLSEITLPDVEKLILQAPTNCGKTTFFAKKASGRRVLLVPTKALALQVEKEHGIKAVYQGVQVSRDDRVLVGTYECIEKLAKTLNTYKYGLWVDEAHNLVQSTSINYRNESLSQVYENFDHFCKVVLMSGTWVKTNASAFQDFETLRVRSREKQVGKFFIVPTKDTLQSIVEKVKSFPHSLHLVYLNDKRKAESTAKILSEIGSGQFMAVHSDNKDSQLQKYVIETGLLPKGFQGLVVTDLFKEGISLLDKADYCVHLHSKADSITTEQIINRVRRSVPTTCCYLSAEGVFSTEVINEEQRLSYEREVFAKAEKLLAVIESMRQNMISKGLAGDWSASMNIEKVTSNLLGNDTSQYIVLPKNLNQEARINELGVANLAFQNWCRAERKNPSAYISNIIDYGYHVELLKDETLSDATLKKRLREDKQAFKDNETKQVESITSEFTDKGFEYVEEINRVKTASSLKLKLAARYLFLYNTLCKEEDVIFLLKENYATKAWNRLEKQLKIQQYIYSLPQQENLLSTLTGKFCVGQKYSSKDIKAIIQAAFLKFGKNKDYCKSLTSTKAVQKLKLIFKVKRDREGKYIIIKAGALDYDMRCQLVEDILLDDYQQASNFKNETTATSTVEQDEFERLIMTMDFNE